MTESCPYCGQDFDRGEHIAEQHVDSDSSIPQVSNAEEKKRNKIREWEKEVGTQ